jgi:hypothetical protein
LFSSGDADDRCSGFVEFPEGEFDDMVMVVSDLYRDFDGNDEGKKLMKTKAVSLVRKEADADGCRVMTREPFLI